MEQATQSKNKFWLITWNKNNGKFNNASITTEENRSIEELSRTFEEKHPDYRVIHIGNGELPPKTYRSLEYI